MHSTEHLQSIKITSLSQTNYSNTMFLFFGDLIDTPYLYFQFYYSYIITGCCKANAKINRKIENSKIRPPVKS